MVIKEYHSTRADGVRLVRSYSNLGLMIRKLGTQQIYSEAIDVENAPYRYVETETPITKEETEA